LVLPLHPTTGDAGEPPVDPELLSPADPEEADDPEEPAVLEDPELLVEPEVDVDAVVGDPEAPDVVPVEVPLLEPDGLELALLEAEVPGAVTMVPLEVVPAVLEDPELLVEPEVEVDAVAGDPEAPDVVPVEVPLLEPDGLELALLETEVLDPVTLVLLEVVPALTVAGKPPLEGALELPVPEAPEALPVPATGAPGEPRAPVAIARTCCADTVAPTSAKSRVTRANWAAWSSSVTGAPTSAVLLLIFSRAAPTGVTTSELSPALCRMD
jgi:hypothetical protein